MSLTVKFKGICRPPEYVAFLESHFRDAILDYEPDTEKIRFLLYKDKWESRRIQRRGRDAIRRYTTDKERANMKVEWGFE